MKKICLALILFLGLAAVVPARAAGTQTIMTSEVSLPSLEETPVIDVTVPQTGRIIINPYGLPTEIDGGTTTEQIASETLTVFNNSEVPVIISASVSGHISELSSMTFASALPQEDTEEKEVFLYAEFQNEDGLWSGSYDGSANQILICEGTSEAKEVLTLAPGPSEGVFRMFDATSVYPADPWNTEDRVSVVFTFTFSAVTEPAQEPVPEERSDAGEDSVPEESSAPEEPSAPGETFMPEESPAPEESPVPEETPAPEESPAPAETPGPEESPPPEVTPAPEVTSAPESPSELETTGGDPNELE